MSALALLLAERFFFLAMTTATPPVRLVGAGQAGARVHDQRTSARLDRHLGQFLDHHRHHAQVERHRRTRGELRLGRGVAQDHVLIDRWI